MHIQLWLGDCLVRLKEIPENSQDAVISDPPYELNFMGKGWDNTGIAFSPELYAELYRILKPGGNVRIFSATRTYHRVAQAMKNAGFESISLKAWCFGSGFPKSLNISKAIDKAGGNEMAKQAAALKEAREQAGLTREQVAKKIGCTASSVRDWEEGRSRAKGQKVEFVIPSEQYRQALSELLGFSVDERIFVGEAQRRAGDGSTLGLGHSGMLTQGGVTELSQYWKGYGTALKPAWEPIICARKP
jgi:site-specific DNA-methyltransferase (adenine-specific)